MTEKPRPELPERPTMRDFQHYVEGLERFHDWLHLDLVHTIFLMTEEVGELAGSVRRY